MPAIRHSWLFEPGSWRAAGTFWENGEIEREARGSSIVRHAPEAWWIDGEIEILGEPPVRFQNSYEVASRCGDTNIIPWRSRNPDVGVLNGTFVVAGDTIMSLFRSEDGRFAGSEHLTRLASDRYLANGLFMASGEVISSWSMELIRQS
jgi:hypothetical protein